MVQVRLPFRFVHLGPWRASCFDRLHNVLFQAWAFFFMMPIFMSLRIRNVTPSMFGALVVHLLTLVLQALPEDKKPLSAELFWLTFRLHAGLPLSPRDPHPGVYDGLGESDTVCDLFEKDDTQCHGNREKALATLCSFAEGGYKRKKSKVRRTRPFCSMTIFKVYFFVVRLFFSSEGFFFDKVSNPCPFVHILVSLQFSTKARVQVPMLP